MSALPEYVTKPELDLRLKGITDRQTTDREREDDRLISMEKLLDSKLTLLQMQLEKHEARTDAKLSEMRAEMNDMRGDVKALNAKVDTLQTKLGMYISILGIGISVVLVIFQLILK